MELDSPNDEVADGSSGPPSLQRLKTLASLPSLDASLDTASELCNHGYRAEMILKWLLPELQKSSDTRINRRSWELFGQCLRLIPPQRIGPQLARFDLGSVVLQTLEAQMQTSKHGDEEISSLILAVGNFFDVIYEISSQPHASAVRAIIAFDATRAATLFGLWAHKILQATGSRLEGQQSTSDLLQPAFRIWDSRRSGSSDNEAFAGHCLEPLTAILGCDEATATTSTSSKRKLVSGESASIYNDHRAHIERLLARHVFLPARIRFNEKENATASASDALKAALEPIRASIATERALREQLCAATPALLNVALRCITLSTIRQRSKERPWIEHVFRELISCLEVNGKLVRPQSVWSMLEIINKRASLSPALLKELTQDHSGLATRSGADGVDFELIARVIAIDANVFVGEYMASQIFAALTKAPTFDNATPDYYNSLLVGRIAIPLVKAFASSRRLDDFFILWSDQLHAADNQAQRSVWREINDTVAELVENHLTVNQIEALLGQYAVDSKTVDAALSAVDRAVILQAILTGIESDELRDKFYIRAGEIFKGFFDLLKHDSTGKEPPSYAAQTGHTHFWLLLSAAFQLWFPRWSAYQADVSAVAAKAQSLLSSQSIDPAVTSLSTLPDSSRPEPAFETTAEAFLGQLLAHLHSYEGCQEHASRIAQRVCRESVHAISPAFVAYPELLNLVSDSRQALFSRALRQSAKARMDDASRLHSALRTIMEFAMSSEDVQLKEQLVMAFVQPPSEDVQPDEMSAFVDVALDCLLYIEPPELTRTQRQKIFDSLTAADGIMSRHGSLNKLIALLVHVMGLPNPAATICNDASVLWRVATSSSPDASGSWSSSTLFLLRELTRLILSHLLPTQDQPRSLKALESFYRTNIQQMRSAVKEKKVDNLGHLVIMETIARMLDPVKTKLGADEADDKHTTRFTELLLKQGKKLWKHYPKSGIDEPTDLKLSVLLNVLETYAGLGLTDGTALEELARDVANGSRKQRDAPKSAVQAHKILSRLRATQGQETAQLLSVAHNMSAADREAVLDTVSDATGSDQLELFGKLMPEGHEISPESMLVLHRGLVSITKETFAANDQREGHALVDRLLTILRRPTDFAIRTGAISCLLTIIRDKTFLINQHLAESTLTTINELAKITSTASSPLYLELCALLTALLTHHRARLQNRFHLLTSVLQSLLSRLFTPNKTSTISRKPLAIRHARAYTRLLTLLCNPPNHHHRPDSTLVDQARRARAHVGQYAPYLLHSFCAQILTGTLGEGMREVLTPGLWALVECMEVRGPEAVKALSSATNNSERAVLRGVYDEWRRFGRWEGA